MERLLVGESELQAMDSKIWRFFTLYIGLHPTSDVDRLYMPRKIGERSLITIEHYEKLAVRGLEVCIHGNEERLIHIGRGDMLKNLEAPSVFKKGKKEKRLQDWEKKLYIACI